MLSARKFQAMAFLVAAATLLCPPVCAAETAAEGATEVADSAVSPGLTVGKDGVLLKQGKPYRGMGINYFGVFYDTLLRADDTGYKEGFRVLADHRIPFVRFMATAFWPEHMELYQTDKAAYFERLDAVVHEAERTGVGLIPSLFWYYATVPDLVGEPMDQWGDPDSKTRRFMRTYTREVVTRYRDSPAIWGWEFGNEYNLMADLPNAPRFRPRIRPDLGTPDTRSERDDMTGEILISAWTDFGRTVRKLDPHRAIFSGNSKPRRYAFHNWTENSWTLDTREQFNQMLLRDNPDPIDILTIHLYANAENLYFAEKVDLSEIVRVAMAASKAAGKPLFVGEFGASRERWKGRERERIEEMIGIIETQKVPLAAVWVFELDWQEGTHNITAHNDRSYILRLLSEANARIRASADLP